MAKKRKKLRAISVKAPVLECGVNIRRCRAASRHIWGGFNWSETSEGFIFWASVADRLSQMADYKEKNK